ncbi:MAG: Hsp20/alpha crystallin family protein [Oligoflexia bacterium]|nr:Hsp20/alpha crystallin family protein [Oligoflexia bacterium]MBF0364639.1 Hsp20/alpha crystallin family protein [Oligoflexia bacterium]
MMTILEQLLSLQKNLDDLFDMDVFPGTTFSRGVFPAINLFEKGDMLVLKAELPGIEKSDISIDLKNSSVLLSGSRNEVNKDRSSFHRKEHNYGPFRRKIELPFQVNPDKCSASLVDGVLTVHLEKEERAKSRLISIK